MRWRIIGLIIGVAVCLVTLVAGVGFWLEQRSLTSTYASQRPRPKVAVQPIAAQVNKKPASEAKPALDLYPKRERSYTWPEAEREMDHIRDLRKTIPAAEDFLASWYNFLSDPSFTGTKNLSEHAAKLQQLVAVHPRVSSLLVALAKTHLKMGWDARGTGPAELVTEDGRRQMAEHAATAKKLLEQAIAIGVQDGGAHMLLLDIARIEGQPIATARQIFADGRKQDRDYANLYQSMAEYLLPRWHGQPGDAERFACEIAREMLGDDGIDVFLQIAYNVNQFDTNLLFWGEYDRGLLSKAAELAVKRHAEARNLVPFAALCTIAAQDHAAAQRVRPFVKYDDAPRVWVWQSLAREFYRWAESPDVAAGRCDWIWGAPLNYGTPAFAADGKSIWCAGGMGALAAIQWDLVTKKALEAFPTDGRKLDSLAFDGSKNWLMAAVSGKDPAFLLWTTGQADAPVFEHLTIEACQAVAINPRLPQVAWAAGGRVYTFDMPGRKQNAPLEIGEPVHAIRYSADGGSLAVSGTRFTVCDIASGNKRWTLPASMDATMTDSEKPTNFICEKILEFDEQGRLWAIGFTPGASPPRRAVARFEANGFEPEILQLDALNQLPVQPLTAVLSANRRQLAIAGLQRETGDPAPIYVFDLVTKQRQELSGQANPIGGITFSPDGMKLAIVGASGSAIKIWALPTIE